MEKGGESEKLGRTKGGRKREPGERDEEEIFQQKGNILIIHKTNKKKQRRIPIIHLYAYFFYLESGYTCKRRRIYSIPRMIIAIYITFIESGALIMPLLKGNKMRLKRLYLCDLCLII